MFSNSHIRRQLVVGFLLLILVMAGIITTGLYQLHGVTKDLRMQVFDTNVKLQLVSDMHEAVHIRRNSLYRIVETEDSFQRADEWDIFNQAASTYLAARQQFSSLIVSENEKNLLEELDQLTIEAQPYQLEVIELVYEGYQDEASEVLFDTAKPMQKAVIEKLGEILIMEEQVGIKLSDDASAAYDNAFYIMLLLGLLAIALSITIGIVVTHNVSEHIKDAQSQQRKYRTLFESSLDAIILWHDWKLIQCNDTARRLFRINHHTESSLTILDLLPKRQNNGDEPAKVLSDLLEKTTEFELFHCDMQRTNGEILNVDIRISRVVLDGAEIIQMLIRDISGSYDSEFSEILET